jgi:signal transduction histidine kinase
VFAVGSAIVFLAMYFVVARAVQERSDSWLVAESETLRQVALSTPRDALYDRTVEEVAELASQEGSYGGSGHPAGGNTVFFAYTDSTGRALVWVGPSNSGEFLSALQRIGTSQGRLVSLRMSGWRAPFRVVTVAMNPGGGHIYLGLLDAEAASLMSRLLLQFALGWIIMVAFGFLVTLLGLRRMLRRVDAITGTAASIRSDDLSTRVPVENQRDEVARLARTFNNMLDRISSTVNQLRTLTDAMAHDLKSPITSVRGSLEMALSLDDRMQSSELVAGAIEQLDRLSDVITTSLDLAEADGGALRLRLRRVDLGDLVGRVTELYAPAFADNGQQLAVQGGSPIPTEMDVSLCTRLLSNLMENELRYGGAGAQVVVTLSILSGPRVAACITVEDNGPGFPAELLEPGATSESANGAGLPRVFYRFVKGRQSKGHGLGLAFVNAVAVAHGGRAIARNRPEGGAQIVVELPLAAKTRMMEQDAPGVAVG